MQNFSADLLEFESLRQLLARFVHSTLGAAELDKLEPHTDRSDLEAALADVAEAVAYLGASRQPKPLRAAPPSAFVSIPFRTCRRFFRH